MSKKQKLLAKILNNPKNLRFDDFVLIIQAFGFELVRITGSHHIFFHPSFNLNINVQPDGHEAKPYQVNQFLRLVQQFQMSMNGEA